MSSTDRGGAWLLVVDDSECTRRALDLLLSESRHTVRCAADGWEALDLLTRAPPPDAIILDLCMPGMGGRSLMHRLKADPALAGIPAILVSGQPGVRHEAEELGAAGFLPKPLAVDDLLLLLARIRRSRPPPAEAKPTLAALPHTRQRHPPQTQPGT
jgi:two-component system CheB/CheR fusion protein